MGGEIEDEKEISFSSVYGSKASRILNIEDLRTMGNSESSPGGMTMFNIDYGMEEALLRGFRSGFITGQQYAALMDYKESTSASK